MVLIDGLDKSLQESGNIDVQAFYLPKEFYKFLEPIFFRYLQGRAYAHNEKIKFKSW